jgi:protein phosphatase
LVAGIVGAVMMQVAWGTATDRGRFRRINEDAHLAEPPVFLVSDGMGGHAAGEVAAAIVVDEFRSRAGQGDVESAWVTECIVRAGRRIRDGVRGGATVVGAAVVNHSGDPYWLAFNIGDSRAYRCADGELTQISVDHSYVQELVDAGELTRGEVRHHPQRNVITRAVGLAGDGDPDCWLIPGREGDRLLFCSDGVTGELDDAGIKDILVGHVDPQIAADELIAAALRAGGRDNATAVVVDVLAVAAGADPATTARRPERSEIESTRPRGRQDGRTARTSGRHATKESA